MPTSGDSGQRVDFQQSPPPTLLGRGLSISKVGRGDVWSSHQPERKAHSADLLSVSLLQPHASSLSYKAGLGAGGGWGSSTSPRSVAERIIPVSPHSALYLSSPSPGPPASPSWQLPRGMDQGQQNPVFLPQPQPAPEEGGAQESSPTTPRSQHLPAPTAGGVPSGSCRSGLGWVTSHP